MQSQLFSKVLGVSLCVALVGCTGGGFKVATPSILNEVFEVELEALNVTIDAPAENHRSSGQISLAGKCTSGLKVEISGDVANALEILCDDGQFNSNIQLSANDGMKTIQLVQRDTLGRTSTAQRIFIKDSSAPMLSVITPSQNQNVRDSVVIQGACEAGISVQLIENGMTYNLPCTSGTFGTTFPLRSADGEVILRMSQTDEVGNTQSRQVTVRKDTIAPQVTISSPAANASVTSSVTVTGTCESGLEVQVAGSGSSAPVTGPCTSGSYSISSVLTSGAGSKLLQVSQTDASGNVGSASRSVDRQADMSPAITISAPAANSLFRTNFTMTGTCQNGLSINLSGAGLSSPNTTTCSNGMFSVVITPTNGDGSKNIIASQTSAQGLTGSISRTFIRDNTPPALTIVSPAANAVFRTQVGLMGACENGINIQISGAGVATPTAIACGNGAYSASVTFSSGDGSKLIQVSQTDAAGNSTTQSRSFIKDTTAPTLAFTSPAAGTAAETGLTITGSCESSLTVLASGTGLSSNTTGNCVNNAFSMNITFSSGDGTKAVQISQTDIAGNTGTATRSFSRATAVSLDGVALYSMNCASCHGALASSTKSNRTAAQISSAISSISQMTHLNFLTQAQRSAIADALYVAPTAPAFACEPSQSLEEKSIAKNLKRLSMRQYRNTLNDLLSRAFTAATVQTMVTQALNNLSFPSDDDTQFSRADSTVVRQHMYAYFEIADRISNQATASANYSTLVTAFINLDRGTCTSINTSALSSACATRFIENFGRRSLRRPLSATTENNETASYLAIYNNAGGNAAGIGAVMFKFLMAPNFLYQIENDGTLVSGRLHRLSSYALASRLSYLFWNSMPDEQLLTYAATMNLSDNTNYTTVLNYVANSPRSADSMREFMNEWLHLKSIPQFSTNNPSLNFLANGLTLDSALRTAMIQEVEELGAYALQNNLSLQDLFTTDISFARDSRLMSIYGVSTAAAATVTPQNATRFPAGQRSGLLTRAALLTGGSELANPIKRGLKVRKDVMCLEIQSPPAELEDALEPPAVNVNFSTRQRYDHATSAPTCMNCHQYINSIGHAFSAYNSFGKYWTQEPTFNETGAFSGNYVPVNSQVDLTISLGSGLSADNANQFSQLVSNHRNTKQCFSEKMLRFAEARPIDKSKEGCRLNDMYSQLNEARSLKDFLRTLANAEEFRHRVIAN